jgi:hypothetical protein
MAMMRTSDVGGAILWQFHLEPDCSYRHVPQCVHRPVGCQQGHEALQMALHTFHCALLVYRQEPHWM